MGRPIFVVGAQRTGTTWLANTLCRHSGIAGVQADKHHGIHESVFFSHLDGRYGDLRDPAHLRSFVEAFTGSDYFRLTGLDPRVLVEAKPRSYSDAFRLVMDSFAAARGVDLWLEKSPDHSIFLEHIAAEYPDALFLSIRRDPVATTRSVMRLAGCTTAARKLEFMARHSLRFTSYYRHIGSFLARHPARLLQIEYREMRAETRDVLTRICRFLGLDMEDGLLESGYAPNTSFREDSERQEVLSPREERLVRLLHALTKSLPFHVHRAVAGHLRRSFQTRLPAWFYSDEDDGK